MRSIIFTMIILLSIMLTSCNLEPEWNGTVRYEITGTTPDADIIYNVDNDYTYATTKNNYLPWTSGSIPVNAGDQSDFNAYVKVTNNTANIDPISVYIYIDDKLVNQKTGSGANCIVSAFFNVTNEY